VGNGRYNTCLEELEVGDLVTFCGYSYTPDYMIIDEERDGLLGMVIARKITPAGYTSGVFKTYTVFWLKSGTRSTEIRDHLRLAT